MAILTNQYEAHVHPDPSIPIFFHNDIIRRSSSFLPHWHEAIEVLFVTEGTLCVLSDTHRFTANVGDFVVINSGHMHRFNAYGDMVKYHCLIIDKSICDEVGIDVEDIVFEKNFTSPALTEQYNSIKKEIENKEEFYKVALKAKVIDFLVSLYRHHALYKSMVEEKTDNTKKEIIKKAMKFIQENYNENISTSNIAQSIGLSLSYFCRTFKEITGMTPVLYLNYLRCFHAKKLFQTGKYTVSEAATLCGFDNLSYFTKTYKKHMGKLPSQFKKEAN